MWDAAVQCLRQHRVPEHHLSAHEWLNEGMYLVGNTQERLLASYIDEFTPQPMEALFRRVITVQEAETAAAEANAPGAGVPLPSASEAALLPAARAAAGRATAAAGETPAAEAVAATTAGASVAELAATAVAVARGRDLGHNMGGAAAAAAPPDTAEVRRHPGGGQQLLRQVHVDFMVAHRRGHAERAGDTSGSHVCGWCGQIEASISQLRAHMQRPNCATAGASVADYYGALGLDKWHTCEGCGDTCTRPRAYRCACVIAGREPQWTERGSQHQRRAPARAHDASDALRRRSDRAALGDAPPVGTAPGPVEVQEPHEIVRCFTADFVAATEFDRKTAELWDVLGFFGGDEAQVDPKAEHNVDEEFVSLMEELNGVAANVQTTRQRLPEPNCARRGALLQAQAAVAMMVLPGLARRMLRTRGWKTPSTMKAQLGSIHLVEKIARYGRAAALLDYFVLPFVRAHPRAAPLDGGRNTVKEETLKHLVREGKLSKAMGLARMKHDAEERGLNTTARPTKAQIERTVADKFQGHRRMQKRFPRTGSRRSRTGGQGKSTGGRARRRSRQRSSGSSAGSPRG